MKLFTTVLTFGATPVKIVAANCSPVAYAEVLGAVSWFSVTSLAANTHACYIGTSAITNDASGTGVLTQLPSPVAGVVAGWQMQLEHPIDITQLYFHGFTGEKVVVGFVTD